MSTCQSFRRVILSVEKNQHGLVPSPIQRTWFGVSQDVLSRKHPKSRREIHGLYTSQKQRLSFLTHNVFNLYGHIHVVK